MIYHVHIDKLIIYPDPIDPVHGPVTITLYGTINDVPVPVFIPNDIPINKPAIRAYLLTKQALIIEAYRRNLLLQPTHNYDVEMDFDWDVP